MQYHRRQQGFFLSFYDPCDPPLETLIDIQLTCSKDEQISPVDTALLPILNVILYAPKMVY